MPTPASTSIILLVGALFFFSPFLALAAYFAGKQTGTEAASRKAAWVRGGRNGLILGEALAAVFSAAACITNGLKTIDAVAVVLAVIFIFHAAEVILAVGLGIAAADVWYRRINDVN